MFQNLIYEQGYFITGVIVIGSCIGISLLGLWLVQKFLALAHRRSHNDVIGFAAGTGGLIYVVLLAFIASTVWVGYDRSDNLVNHEASLTMDLFNDSAVLPKSFTDAAQPLLRDYARAVVTEEWPNMKVGDPIGKQGWPLLKNFYAELGRVPAVSPVQVAVVQEMLTRLNQLYDARRERSRTNTTPCLPGIVWFVVLAGGFITVSFSWLFGFEKKGLHEISTAMIAAILGLVIFLIVVFNYPFRGQTQISSAPFDQALRYMDSKLSAPSAPPTTPTK